MNYWLLKSEPDVWSIEQQKKAGIKEIARRMEEGKRPYRYSAKPFDDDFKPEPKKKGLFEKIFGTSKKGGRRTRKKRKRRRTRKKRKKRRRRTRK